MSSVSKMDSYLCIETSIIIRKGLYRYKFPEGPSVVFMNFEVDKGILFGKMVVLTVMINNLSADQQLLVFLRNSHQQFLSPQDWSFGENSGFSMVDSVRLTTR